MQPEFLADATPFLVLEASAFDRNVRAMATAIMGHAGKRWRPHIKGLRAAQAAQALIKAGACGITCSTVAEASAMVEAGVSEVLIANQVVGKTACSRLASLNRRSRVLCAVDHHEQLDGLAQAARSVGVELPLVVELDVGMGRCGCTGAAEVVELARSIAGTSGLQFAGLSAWEGHAVRIKDAGDKAAAVNEALSRLAEAAQACASAGLPAAIVSAGGTGDYALASAAPGITEIQAGGGAYGDLRYREEFATPLECALTLWTTVISRPSPRRIVCDGGFKAVAAQPQPRPRGLQGVIDVRLNAVHTIIELDHDDENIRIGSPLILDIGNADGTVFLHDRLFLRGGDGRMNTEWSLRMPCH